MKTTLATVLSLSLFHSVFAAPPRRSRFQWSSIDTLIAFGDSYTFVQGTAGDPGFSFIGDQLAGNFAFNASTLLSDQIIQNFTGTSAGGPNWVEFISGCAVEDGLFSPAECAVALWNFAYAGADYSTEFTAQHHNTSVQMVNQTQQFLTYAEPVLSPGMDKSKALIAVWIGINDISDTAKWTNVSFPTFYGGIFDAMFAQSITPLFQAGYSNFLFVNLPPLDRTPTAVLSTNPLPNKTMVNQWNAGLSTHITSFAQAHPTSHMMLYDANTFLNTVLNNPAQYNVVNTTGYCPGYTNATVLTDPGAFGCTPIEGYFWFNTGHITSHIHGIMAEDMLAYLNSQ